MQGLEFGTGWKRDKVQIEFDPVWIFPPRSTSAGSPSLDRCRVVPHPVPSRLGLAGFRTAEGNLTGQFVGNKLSSAASCRLMSTDPRSESRDLATWPLFPPSGPFSNPSTLHFLYITECHFADPISPGLQGVVAQRQVGIALEEVKNSGHRSPVFLALAEAEDYHFDPIIVDCAAQETRYPPTLPRATSF